jgi:hydroxymethylpyrimidine/phosphomethylpyrimidine kinase
MMEERKVCLSVAGLDPSGGAGIIADVRTFTAFGCGAAATVTSITFQNSTGVSGAIHQTAGSIRGQLEAIFAEYEIAAAKIGMLPTAEIAHETAKILRAKRVRNIVVDPVIHSTSGFSLIEETAISAIVGEIFPISTLVTPNIPEAEIITGLEIRNRDDIADAARRINSFGSGNVLIKGGHFEADAMTASDFLFVDGDTTIFDADRLQGAGMRGTGCMLSSAIAANLALGRELPDAVRIAKDFVFDAIRGVSDQ